MTEVCKYQSVCNECVGRDRRASSVLATAWIVNWICLATLFGGIVVMSHSIDMLQADANSERALIKAEVSVLAAALKVSPKGVLPHVLKIEEMLTARRCGSEVAGN